MPRFYFHVSNPDECIRDDTGYDLVDLAAAHIRAQDLARGVMRASCLADREPDWRGCTVTVTNDSQVPIGQIGANQRGEHECQCCDVR